MTGLIYKEWKQNRWYILSMILCGTAPLLTLFFLKGEITDTGSIDLFRTVGLVIGFLAAGALQIMVLRGDDRKLFGYWITTTADGYRGFLRVKYEIIFAMIVLFFTSTRLFDDGYCAIAADMGLTEINPVSGIAMPIVFVQILLRAVDIPFTYRFGSKKGSIIKLIYMVAGTLLITVLLLLNPSICEGIVNLFNNAFSGNTGSLIISAALVAILALYYLSYRVTCKLYLKGVEQYDK